MSFSSAVKDELCRTEPPKKCCAVAEAYGVLLYCNTFSARQIRVITASDAFAARLPRLFRRAFGLSFDAAPPEKTEGKRSFLLEDPAKIRAVFSAFGYDPEHALNHHLNLAAVENDCDRIAFLRGAFLAGGEAIRSPCPRWGGIPGCLRRLPDDRIRHEGGQAAPEPGISGKSGSGGGT